MRPKTRSNIIRHPHAQRVASVSRLRMPASDRARKHNHASPSTYLFDGTERVSSNDRTSCGRRAPSQMLASSAPDGHAPTRPRPTGRSHRQQALKTRHEIVSAGAIDQVHRSRARWSVYQTKAAGEGQRAQSADHTVCPVSLTCGRSAHEPVHTRERPDGKGGDEERRQRRDWDHRVCSAVVVESSASSQGPRRRHVLCRAGPSPGYARSRLRTPAA